MADLRIVDAPEIPTENITGEEKLPTGGNGNYSISLDSLADYTKTKKDLADNTSVDGKVNGVRQELDAHIEDLLNPHQVTKGQIGLGNVDNTADADKPVSNSTQAAIISAVSPKADKTYVDTQLTLKANKVDVYTKSETYTKQESSDLVNNSISTALTPINTSLDLAKRGVANRYDSSLTYNSGERVVLANGDIVKSTINENANDPNVDMTGWVNDYSILDQQTIYANYGIVPSERLKIYVERLPIQAILKTDGTDETVNLKAYIAAAKALGKSLSLPKGIITVSDTIDIDFCAIINGSGKEATVLQFKNTTLNKPLISLKNGSSKSYFSNILLRDENFNTSTAIFMSDKRTSTGGAVWKNCFINVGVSGFARGVVFSSENPLAGATHAHCDDNYFASCSFTNNKVAILVQNTQAVVNLFIGCEFENSDGTWINGEPVVDDNFTIVEDQAGGGIVIINASVIGRGRWYKWVYPTGGTGLFVGSGAITYKDARGELRSPHCGVLFDEGIHGVFTHGGTQINVSNCNTLNEAQAVDLIRFGGAVKASFQNVSVAFGTGSLTIRQYPTVGKTANNNIGSRATVIADNCSDVFYVKETSSPYGTYDTNATANVSSINPRTNSPNNSFTTDSDGWSFLTGAGAFAQLPWRFGLMPNPSRIVYNSDAVDSNNINSGVVLKLNLPKGARPLKLFCNKNQYRRANDQSFKLYLVKDKANWATSTFDKSTDAFLVASTASTLNKSGYFEATVEMVSAGLGNELKAGTTGWMEGRILIEYVGTTMFSGFVGVEYI